MYFIIFDMYQNFFPLTACKLLKGREYDLFVLIEVNSVKNSFKIWALGKQILRIFLASDVSWYLESH
jgi:hypothetical protein